MLSVNEYFEGQVKSISFEGEELPASIGVMAPGEYAFGTSQREYMTVVSGELIVKLPGSDEWQVFRSSEMFVVEADQRFDLKVERDTAY
ncbi:MAG: pyrimidine/purine nucleoside phosphorylase, partial [Halioglobus sp.]|nr:pyrimidine/purine nucleoside phosphorylase [Halioglobus sp.]